MMTRTLKCMFSVALLGMLIFNFFPAAEGIAASVAMFKMMADSEEDMPGYPVSVSGDYAVAGVAANPSGFGEVAFSAAYVYKREGASWTKMQKLTPDEGENFDASFSISGDYIAVNGSGRVHMFKREGDTWIKDAVLRPDDDAGTDGCSVSANGDNVTVGIAGYDAAYIFKREGGVWRQEAKLFPSDIAEAGSFGDTVSIDGDYAIFGNPGDDSYGEKSGAAYIFKRDGSAWHQMAKLTPSDAGPYRLFGFSVSISGDYAIMGSLALLCEGAAYIFKRDGETWTEQSRLTAREATELDTFGLTVSLSGDYAVVGAPTSDSGYIFKRNGNDWTQLSRLISGGAETHDRFGVSVAISEGNAILGTEYEGAYIWQLDELGDKVTQEMPESDPVSFDFGDASESGGSSVSITPTEGSGSIGVTQYDETPDTLPEGMQPSGPAYDIDDSEYTGKFPMDVIFTWGTTVPLETGALLLSTDGENWIDAESDPGVSNLVWNLTTPPYSVSFTTCHFSKWVLGTKDEAPGLSVAARWMGAVNDGSPEFIRTDMNDDGEIDLFDLLAIVDITAPEDPFAEISRAMQLLGAENDDSLEFRQTDMNDDGEIDLFDLLAMVDHSLSETAVKEAEPELVAAVTWMGASDDGSPEFEQNDVNGDGVIDLFDLLDIVDHQPADL